MPYVDSNLGDYVQNEIPLATLQEMVTAGTVPPNQVFLTPESEDVGMTNVYVNNELQKTLSFDSDPQTQITENKTNINKKLEPSNIKAGANINITTSGNDVTINAVAEAGGTVVNVNGVKQDVIDFTSDPQTQINSKFNSTNVVQSTGTSTTQVMSQKTTTDALAKKMDNFSISIGSTNGGNPRQVKFMSINYATATSESGVSIKLSMVSGHGNGSSYRFLQDAILGVTYTGVVSIDVYKYYNASVGTFDGAARNYGDVFYVKDETNKIVDFYVLLGQYSTVKLTPYFRLNSSTGGVITQLSGAPTYYSSGTKVYGNNSLYAKKSDIPIVSQSTGTSTTEVMSQKATTDELTAILTTLSTKFTNHPQSAYDCNTCYDEGVYLIARGSNCPSGSQYGSLFVMPYRKPTGNTKPDYCTQIYLPNGDDSTDPNSMFYRTSLADSWNPWQKVATTDELDSKLPMFSSSAYDMNTCTESGIYPISDGTNGPSEKSIGDLFVMKRGDGVCSQLFINLTVKLGSTVYPSKMFYRGKYADGWCPWKEVADYNTLYPVGAIYISTSSKSPASFIGGTWEQILGKFLLSSDDVLTDGTITTAGSYHVGDSGGEATHKLKKEEMPSHTHSSQTCVGWQTGGGNSVGRVTSNNGNYNGWPTTIYNTGGDKPHNNMPPYYTVYMWRRTA